MDQNRPERIGRYRIDGELGRGAMGVVYRGHDEDIDRPVALKTVRADLLDGPEAESWLARFRQEARAAARCLHPNIVTVFEYGEDQGLAFIAMEYVSGRSLQAFLARDTDFGIAISLRIITQVLAGLGAAHALGVVHRDIKPSNIILLESGAVKVTDFGIARLDSVSLSQHGSMVGTPGYMAPEQFTGGAVDARTDIFAVSIVLYELLTGRKPFPGDSVHEVMFRVLNGSPEPPTGRSEVLPDALTHALMTALRRDPAERFADAAAFRRALKAAAPTPTAPDADQSDDDEDATRIMRFDDTMAGVVSSGPKGELDDAAVRQASAHLASHIGPMASVIVRDAATRVSGVRQLYEVLADHIPDTTERTAFMRKALRGALGLGGGTGTAPLTGTGLTGTGTARPGSLGSRRGTAVGTSPTGGGPGTVNGHGVRPEPGRANGPITDEHREKARRALAEHLGPIAGVLVNREAGRANNPDHLGQLLAGHLPDPDDRDRFLARLRG